MQSFRALFLIAAFALLALMPRDAQAKMYFGDQDYVRLIQDIPLKGPNGEALFLGYRYRMSFFVAGLYVKDEGYVLGVKGNSERFFRMPDAIYITKWQSEGLLPKPFPPYRLNAFDYLIGYSFWPMLAAIIGFGAISWLRRRRAEADTAQWNRMSDSVPTRLPGAAP